MTDTDFFKAMHQGLPKIKPPADLSVVDSTGLLLGNADIEINNHEALWGVCAEETNDDQ